MLNRCCDLKSVLLLLLPVLLVAIPAIPFVAAEEIVAAALLALLIIVATEAPLALVVQRRALGLTLALRLLAILIRMVAALGCAALLAPHYTGAFFLIFSLSLALSVMAGAMIMCSLSQEPVHE